MPTIKRIELINNKEFAKMLLNKNIETFIVYIVFLFAKEIEIPVKYLDFFNVFLEKNALILPKIINLN